VLGITLHAIKPILGPKDATLIIQQFLGFRMPVKHGHDMADRNKKRLTVMIGNNPQNLGGDFAVPSHYCSIETSIWSGPSEHMEMNQIFCA
jgi:hypothetical protein